MGSGAENPEGSIWQKTKLIVIKIAKAFWARNSFKLIKDTDKSRLPGFEITIVPACFIPPKFLSIRYLDNRPLIKQVTDKASFRNIFTKFFL